MLEAGLRLKLSVQMMMLMIVIVLVVMRTDDHVAARIFGDLTSGGEGVKQKGADAALELTSETFNTSLWASPAPSVIVEFYAHW